MSIIINVNVICKDEQNPNGYLYAFLSKEYNTTLIPMNGMEFEDFAWKNPRIIQNTTLCPENNCYSLWLGNDIMPLKIKTTFLKI